MMRVNYLYRTVKKSLMIWIKDKDVSCAKLMAPSSMIFKSYVH